MECEKSVPSVDKVVPVVVSDDEDSFVVLGTSASDNETESFSSLKREVLPPLRTNKVHEMQSLIKMKLSQISSEEMPELPAAVDALGACSLSVSKINLSPDLSNEEIQKQVEELIKENETLKTVIAQNNMSMKTQYERFVGYKDEVTKVMKSYKDKFNEAKVCIDKLKEENVKLAGDIEVYMKIKKLQEEEIINLKDKIKEHESKNSIDVKSTDPDLNAKLKDLQTALAEVELKNKELTDENQLVVKLKEEVKKLTAAVVSSSQIEEGRQQELNLLKMQKNALEAELKDVREKLEEKLNEEMRRNDASKENIVQLENLVANYKEQLKAKDCDIVLLKQNLERTTFSESTLQDLVTTLKIKINDLQNTSNPSLEDYNQTRSQLSSAQATITRLKLDLDNRAKEIEELQRSNARSDEIFALREQVEVYKNDFEAERRSKDEFKKERNQIAEDLKNVQKRNKQLQNEIETMRARQHPSEEGYICPKCTFRVSSYQALENHVHRCLDQENFP